MRSSLRKAASFFCLALSVGCAASSDGTGNAAIVNAWRASRSDIEVTATGNVVRVLGTRAGQSGMHERFLVHLRGGDGGGLTVRVDDNINVTGPVPLEAGEDVVVHGVYIYDPSGGVIHWTHRVRSGHHEPGYIKAGGRLYQ